MTGTAVIPAVLTALASACAFACSTSLQHRVAGTVPASVRGPARMMRQLIVRPLWVLGTLVSLVAVVLHGIALGLGAIAVVQPLMIAGVVLAVPVRAALDRRLPSRGELAAVSLAAAGLATFVVVADPRAGTVQVGDLAAISFVLCGLLVAAGVAVVSARRERAWPRAFGLGVASGVLFGLTAGLLKFVARQLDTEGLAGTLASWPLWTLAVAGCLGVAINQCAYQIAPLTASMPVINVVDVLVALLFGWVIFGEVPAHGAPNLLTQGAALACAAIGLRLIARTTASRHADPASVPQDHTEWSKT